MDPLSNMLIAIKNGSRAGRESIDLPFSAFSHTVAECLVRAGFLKSTAKKMRHDLPILVLTLAYNDKIPKVSEVKRISKLSRRIYRGVKELHPVRSGLGSIVLSTPKGVLTGDEARKEHVGGEVLFEIW
ncbi:30S ribosomal protein S8 [Candidatus Nomurabacteria bacterium RIFCSPLOWO2_02_FULL_42_17]|uniref:Small ribosomal subunit protein uS8 n=2 Tax=Candidatus Nomuraibacteriota TaxID=1752729 RepID=A0A1F6WGK1_9BACT|nr:MAG: 30S ribosomal protein S8 [Parcubacteria group bacterium GW2011_GWA2_42_18]OGI81047.1 MAG: 30S ribosomal protein S8 [Candidatus Nomurabacteria bacterium RIFCSPHIGHO2_02_FULL_42_24]OGI97723.1 MAG: 30S ribosomal protein S8 [Candidatus Nomurabacteria bacterium RIFCSPLOWO2_02_FULL_42_17]